MRWITVTHDPLIHWGIQGCTNQWIHGPQCPGTAVASAGDRRARKSKKHVTMGARPSVRTIGEGLATLDLRGSHQGAC
eukprot:COSAG03_NODE_5475_length_1242_cov_5.997375_1_plen_77_part_10